MHQQVRTCSRKNDILGSRQTVNSSNFSQTNYDVIITLSAEMNI